MRCERGQAAIEWVGLVLVASLTLGALVVALPLGDARSYAGALSDRILCAVRGGGCSSGEAASFAAAGTPQLHPASQSAPGGGRGRDAGRSAFVFGPWLGIRAGSGPRARRRSALGFSPGVYHGYPQTPDPCKTLICQPAMSRCEKEHSDPGPEALCKIEAAAELEPGPLARFLNDQIEGCAAGAVGADVVGPVLEEVFRRKTIESPAEARRALERGLRRARDGIAGGKARPGLLGCLGGVVGL